MKDLKIRYSQNGVLLCKSYDTIMDFTDTISDGEMTISDVEAEFFENRVQHFDTLGDLKEHCEKIMK